MKRHARQLCADLAALGFDHIWTNSSGYLCYAHPDDPQQQELSVSPTTNENGARALLHRARRIARAHPDPLTIGKRNPRQLKERAAAQRQRARDRLAYATTRRDQLTANRADPAALTAAQALIERREQELAAIEHLMRQPPAGGHTHRGTGQPRHYAGPAT